MSRSPELGGAFAPAGTSFTLNRIGYGAIKLTGPMAWGPPNDRQAAAAAVREAVHLGINHIDTSDYYGPYIANEIIREAVHPYPEGLTIVTKVGARRGPDKSWPAALSKPMPCTTICGTWASMPWTWSTFASGGNSGRTTIPSPSRFRCSRSFRHRG
jgi:hypothetical protein